MSVTESVPIRLQLQASMPQPAEVVVGKDVLELVTGAMYVEPLCLYREYVQNAADSLDEAARLNWSNDPKIDIRVDVNDRRVLIRDNGIGVPSADFSRRMCAIGGSEKRQKELRGFRGVGRLAGLGYCRELLFRSKGPGDDSVCEVKWDGRRFREILRKANYPGSLIDVVQEISTFEKSYVSPTSETFFEVELRGLARVRNDVLLNVDLIERYLSQVAPVAFHDDFKFGRELDNRLAEYGIIGLSSISISEMSGTIESKPRRIRRPHRNLITLSPHKLDRIEGVRFLELPGVEGGIDAVAWFADHEYMGAIPSDQLVKGVRFRVGNIQVGPDDIACNLFPEARFNSWFIGEVHVLNRKIVPNGRRDNFDDSVHLENLQANLIPQLKEVARTCRRKSGARQWLRRFEGAEQDVSEDLKLLEGGGLSKRGATRLGKAVDEKMIALEYDLQRDPYGLADRLKPRIAKLRRKLDSLRSRDLDPNDDPLSAVPRLKRLAFQEVLELIYANAQNKPVANGIVERIVKQLAARYGAK